MRILPDQIRFSRRAVLPLSGAVLWRGCLAKGEPPAAPHKPARPQFRILAPVQLNDRGPFLFAVDTSAVRTVVADDVAAQLSLASPRNLDVKGVIDSISVPSIFIEDVSVVSGDHRGLEVPVLKRELLECDGEVGLDVLSKFRVRLDFATNAVAFEASGGTVLPREEGWVGGETSGKMLWIRSCLVDGVPCRALLSTGAEVSVGNTALRRALPQAAVVGTLPLTGITGGVMQAQVFRSDLIQIGSVRFTDALFAVADLALWQTLGVGKDEPALLIGMNFLRQFSQVVIDYPREQFGFVLDEPLQADTEPVPQ